MSVAICVLILGGWELHLRLRGFEPLAVPDASNWALLRSQAVENTTVILGTSRAQAAIDPVAWASTLGGRAPVQLAMQGAAALPVLEHMADDRSFSGTAIVEISPFVEFNSEESHALSASFEEAYRKVRSSPSSKIEAILNYHLSDMVFRRPGLLPRSYWRRLRRGIARSSMRGLFSRPTYWARRKDRFTPLDYSKVDLNGHRSAVYTRMLEDTLAVSVVTRDSLLLRFERATAAIVQRGGHVIYLHAPMDPDFLEAIERYYPRRVFWGQFESRFHGSTVWFQDYPELARFRCPDGSHLDKKDAPDFTRTLATIVHDLVP